MKNITEIATQTTTLQTESRVEGKTKQAFSKRLSPLFIATAIAVLALGLGIPVAHAVVTTIDFDDGTGALLPINDFYAGLGVTFTNTLWISNYGLPGSSGSLAIGSETGNVAQPKSDNPIVGVFDAPVCSVSIVGIDIGVNGARIDVYDDPVGGNLIGSDEFIGPGGDTDVFETLTVDVSGIRRFEIYQPRSDDLSDGVIFDDLAFDFDCPAVNNPPVVDLDPDNSGGNRPNFAPTFTEDGPAVNIGDIDLSVTDVDNTNLVSATVKITNLKDGVNETLTATITGSIIASYDPGAGLLSLTGSDTYTNYQQVLRTVTYDNASQNPNLTDRTITVVANDGADDSTAVTSTVTVNSVNDPPVVDLDPDNSGGNRPNFAPTFTEDGPAVNIGDIDLSVTDVDNTNLVSATVKITNLEDGASETLTATTTGSIIASYDPGAGLLSLTGTDTDTNYRLVLRNVTYHNASQDPDPTERIITVVANDGATDSATVTSTVTVTKVNDPPTTNGIADVTVDEDDPNTTIDLFAAFDDIDNPDDALTYTVENNTNPGLFNATIIDHEAGALTLDYAANATGGADITIRATDPGGLFVETTFTVTVNPVNDPPVVDLDPDNSGGNRPNFAPTFTEDGPAANIGDIDLSVTDVDNTNLVSATVKITNLEDGASETLTATITGSITASYDPNAGLLSLTGSDTYTNYRQVLRTATYHNASQDPNPTNRIITVVANDGADDSATVTSTVTVIARNDEPDAVDDNRTILEDSGANLVDVLANDTDSENDPLTIFSAGQASNGSVVNNGNNLTYTPNLDFTGPDSFSYTISDGNGGFDTATVNVTVTNVNDPPTTSGIADVTADEDAPHTIIDLFAAFDDIDNPDDALTYTIENNTNPGLFNATPIDGQAGTLTLDYAANTTGRADITIRATDPGGLFVETTFTVTVTSVNDPPVANDDAYNVDEDNTLNVSAALGLLANDTDADSNDTLTATLASGPARGILTLNASGSFTYTPELDFFGPDSFTYTVDDGHGGSDTATVNVTVERAADLSISKQASPSPLVPGTTVTYTIVVSNPGPSDVNTATVSDTIPTQIGGASWTCTATGGATCASSGSGDINHTVGLPEGGFITYTVTGLLASSTAGNLVNTATVELIAPPGIDPNTGNNITTTHTVADRRADLSSSQSSKRTSTTVTYTIIVRNLGPSDAGGTTVSDDIPDRVSGAAWSCSPSGGATCTSGGSGDINDTLTNFPAGGMVSYIINGALDFSEEAINTVRVTPPAGVTDPNNNNNTASSGGLTRLYLPLLLLMKKSFVLAPDLVVDRLTASSNAVTVVIKNQGNAPVNDPFWVDVYFNPGHTPGLNQPWETIASHGLVWGVTTPITANGVLTLTIGGDYYFPNFSSPIPLPEAATVYALVDSINFSTSYGNVPESNEDNNLSTPVISTANAASEASQAAPAGNQGQPPSMAGLPPRR